MASSRPVSSPSPTKATAYPGAMETLGVTLTRTEADDHAINRVNTLHSLFHGFISGFRGVSTKRLDEYLAWFLWRRTYVQDQEDIAIRQVNVTMCDDTVRDWAHGDAAIHGLLGRHDIDCMHNVASRNGRSRAWRTRRPRPCGSTPS